MKTLAPPTRTTKHRLARITRWAGLWLMWACACVLSHNTAQLEQRLRKMRLLVSGILLHSAARAVAFRFGDDALMLTRRAHWAFLDARKQRTRHLRAVLGCFLRRALKARGLSGQIGLLIQVLAHPEQLIAHLAKRITRGMTRRLSPAPYAAPSAVPRLALIALPPALADSS